MSGLLGKTLGKYRILARIGRGGMATVYKAYQPGLDRYVAIKALHRHLADDQDFIRRFEREALAVARLRHPNIVQVHDFDHVGDLYYMVMEFIEGPSLREELQVRTQSGQVFTLPEIARVFGALGSAIDYAHQQGMVHHDLKPANIMFTAQGQAVLTDFGIAKIVGGSTQTLTGAVIGTPAYMSPEQGQGQRGDERSDIYSLGIILFEMLTGQVPFDDDTPYTIITRHISQPLPLPSSLKPGLPSEVEQVSLKAAAKSPDERHQTGRELARALYDAVGLSAEHTLSSEPVIPLAEAAQPPSVDLEAEFPPYVPTEEIEASLTRPVDQEPRSRLPRRVILIGAGVLVLFLVVGLVGGLAFGLPNRKPTSTSTAQPSPEPATQPAVATATSVTPTTTATNTPLPTDTPTVVPSLTPTATPIPTPTETPIPPAPTVTEAPMPPSPTPTPTTPMYNRILFKTDRDGSMRVYSMNPDGHDQRPVEDALIYNELAELEALSPDGRQQIVVREDGNAELWLIALDGTQGDWRITYHPGQDFDPAWSPVADKIAFVSEETGNSDIYISTPLGFDRQRITINKDPLDRHPTWSPDGRYLAFWSDAQYSLKQIYIYDTQTGDTALVGGGPYNNWDPLWVKQEQ